MLGAACIVAGHPGHDRHADRHVPQADAAADPLRLEARCTSHEGRKVRAWAAIYHGDVLTAEAEGMFIEVRPEQILAIAEGNIGQRRPGDASRPCGPRRASGAASDVQWDVLGSGGGATRLMAPTDAGGTV